MFKANTQENTTIGSTIREVVFGIEDGMVSTLGAITGIAIGSGDLFTVILAGVVIIAVESISMGIGSYLANRTEDDVNAGRLAAKKDELVKNLQRKKDDLRAMLTRDGWSDTLAQDMSEYASENREVMLKELAFRELHIVDDASGTPVKNALLMYASYIIGGIIPLFAYFFLPVSRAMPISIIVTLFSLFLLGAITTKFTREYWAKAGARILIFGTIALAVGFIVGEIASRFE